MALKFLNKKGWHTGSLRNIENVWKAEQKHEAEQKKLEELRKQIHEEREAEEFRILQEKAGLAPRQERLDFLYDSGLAVGKPSSDEYLLGKPIEQPKEDSVLAKAATTPGALFAEEKPRSANDAWRKLHTDPLFLIRQQEQVALSKIRNNPVKMDMIRKEVELKKKLKEEKRKVKAERKERHRKKRKGSRGREQSDGRDASPESDPDEDAKKSQSGRHGDRVEQSFKDRDATNNVKISDHGRKEASNHVLSKDDDRLSEKASRHIDAKHAPATVSSVDHSFTQRYQPKKLSEEERNARLLEMQIDAERHEEQRWKRLQKASAEDALQEKKDSVRIGRSFIDDTTKRVYGAGKGGSSTVEESIRRRTHYREKHSGDGHSNAFRR